MTCTDLQREPANAAADAGTPSPRPGTVRAFLWLARRPELPWVGVAGLAVSLLASAGNTATDAVIYGVYWLAAIVLPGVLLQRALVGSRSLPEDIGFGAVLGLAWQLIGWFVFTALQLQVLFWAWPIALVVLFAAAPYLRRHWRRAEQVPLTWSWAASASLGVALVVLYFHWLRDTALPPRTRLLEPDLWYHLSINAELTRTIFPDLPYVAGEPLEYHWFANAHMASGHAMTGIDNPSILLHLWLVPMVVMLFLAICALSRWLTRLWWPGVVAATLTVSLPVAVATSSAKVGFALTPIIHASPSSVFAGVVMVGLAHSVLRTIRDRPTPGSWASLALLTMLAAGAKPTLLPLALAGTALSTVYLLARRRPVRNVSCVLGILGVGFLVAAISVMGGTAGSEVRLFGYFRSIEGFRTATDDHSLLGVTGSWVVPGVLESGLAGWILAFAILAAMLLFHLPSLVGIVGNFFLPNRGDVALWWLAGVVLASYGPLLLIDHMGSSQKYFVVAVFPLGMVLTLHIVALTLPAKRGFAFRWSVVGVLLAGSLGATFSAALFGDGDWTNIHDAVVSLLAPVAAFLVMAALVVLWCRRSKSEPSRSGHMMILLCALLLGWSVPHMLGVTVGKAFGDPRNDPTSHFAGPVLPAPKQRAALWLATQGETDDVIVTNAHCFEFFRGKCDVRGFWLSALSGHRVFLEGWGYTAENALTRSMPRLAAWFQPSPWPQKLRDSDIAVSAPTRQLLNRLSDRHNVQWVFADKTVGPPAPTLSELATLRYENRDVAIFELLPETDVHERLHRSKFR